MKMRSARRRGISIAIALLTLAVVAVIGMAVATLGTQSLNLAWYDRNQETARYAAEAGVAAAAEQISQSSSWNAGFTAVALPSNQTCTYTVRVTNNLSGNAAMTASDGTTVPGGQAYLLSTGACNGINKTIGVLMAGGGGAVFRYAAFGMTGVSLGGTSAIEDSYSSSAGAYSASNRSLSNADIGTNATTSGAVTYSGNARNYGNVFIGPGGSAGAAVNGAAGTNYTGTVQTLDTPYLIPAPDPGLVAGTQALSFPSNTSTTIAPGSYASLSTRSQSTITFQPGTYYFSGNVSFGSQNTIQLPSSGVVKIYVGGTWDSGGGTIVNPSNIPANFQLYGTQSCTAITVNGGNSASLVIGAPTAAVTVQGNSGINGAVVGNTVNVQGSASIHYDRDLLNSNLMRPSLMRRAWKNV